jgi:hypothetical protein
LPPFLRLNGGKCRLGVDCLGATPLADVIDVQVVASVGVVTIGCAGGSFLGQPYQGCANDRSAVDGTSDPGSGRP